jgi:transcriptional regulator GlxA family with amidase domain
VDNGRVVCSAGIAAGIDMSLHVVGRLLGREVTERTARQMEYPWQPGPARSLQDRTAEESAMSLKIKVYSAYV